MWASPAAAPPAGKSQKPLSDAEFFGVPELARSSAEAVSDRPEWYQDWLSAGRCQQDFIVWHCAWPAVELFCSLGTQWRHGFDGVTGLDYSAVIAVIHLHYRRNADRVAMLADIQALEHGAMTAINEQRQQARDAAEKRGKSKRGQ